MTKEEIYLIKELIKETVKSVVKETLQEQMGSTIKKDLREVKLLLAKGIKENAFQGNTVQPKLSSEDMASLRQKMREQISEDFDFKVQKPTPALRMSAEQAMNISQNGTLPDFDAPIPQIRKDSVLWKDLKEKVG